MPCRVCSAFIAILSLSVPLVIARAGVCLRLPQGLMPLYLNPANGDFSTQAVSFGAMGDSYYEYLLKVLRPPVMRCHRKSSAGSDNRGF